MLIATLVPLGLMGLLLFDDESAILSGVGVLLVPFVYLVTGIILLFTTRKKLGRILLLSAGIIFLVGFSVCTLIMSNINIR